MITTGSVLQLHKGPTYRIDGIVFEIGETSGSWDAFVKHTDIDTGEPSQSSVSMFEELLRNGNLYPPEHQEFMDKLWKSREQKEIK